VGQKDCLHKVINAPLGRCGPSAEAPTLRRWKNAFIYVKKSRKSASEALRG
jgi:hypothetical protein